MEKFNCICIDDEPLALEVMQTLISNHPNLRLAKTCQNALEAMEWLKSNPTDVVFSDINMPGVSGLDFAKAIKDFENVVIFTTAYQEYALDAFEIEALDFLLKPISPVRFAKTVKKIEEYFDLRRNSNIEKAEHSDGHIFVKSNSKLIKIEYNNINYIEAFADYVKIWISDEKRIVTLQTMKNMEQELPPDKFVRVHRSFIAAIDKISEVQSNSVRVGNKEMPVGKNYKDGLMEIISKAHLSKRN